MVTGEGLKGQLHPYQAWRYREVLRMRAEGLTLDAIGQQWHVRRQRVWSIEQAAKRALSDGRLERSV